MYPLFSITNFMKFGM